MYYAYLDVIEFGYDGTMCNNLEDALKPLGWFKTKEEAKTFFDAYDFDSDYNEAVRGQGYGSVIVELVIQNEDGENVFKKVKRSKPRENATCVFEIRDDSDFERVLETFDDEQEAVKAFNNYHVKEGCISLYEVWKYPDVDDDEEILYDRKEADEDGQEE